MADDTETVADDDPSDQTGLTGATIDNPTSGVSVGGTEGRLLADPVAAGRGEEPAERHGRPGPRGPDSPAASDVAMSASGATSPGVMAERQRIVEHGRDAQETPPPEPPDSSGR